MDYRQMRVRRTPPLVPIRQVRIALGWSLPQLAAVIAQESGFQVSPQALGNAETGARGVSEDVMTAWASALDVERREVRLNYQPRATPERTVA